MQNTSLSSLRLREFIRDTTWCFDFLPVPQVDTIHLPYFLAFTEVLCTFLKSWKYDYLSETLNPYHQLSCSRYFISLIDVSPVLSQLLICLPLKHHRHALSAQETNGPERSEIPHRPVGQLICHRLHFYLYSSIIMNLADLCVNARGNYTKDNYCLA